MTKSEACNVCGEEPDAFGRFHCGARCVDVNHGNRKFKRLYSEEEIHSEIKAEREACADLVTGWFNDVPMDEPIDSQLIDLVNDLGEAIRERK